MFIIDDKEETLIDYVLSRKVVSLEEIDKILAWCKPSYQTYKNVVVITEEDCRRRKVDIIENARNAIWAVSEPRKIYMADLVILKMDDGSEKILKDRYRPC